MLLCFLSAADMEMWTKMNKTLETKALKPKELSESEIYFFKWVIL